MMGQFHWRSDALFHDNMTQMGIPSVQPVTSGLYYKSFTLVIYNHNDSMIVEPLL